MHMSATMKFLPRCIVIFLTMLVLFLYNYSSPSTKEEPRMDKLALGLVQINPWQVRSLQEIGQDDRSRFEKFYDDGRRYFGDGNDHPEPLIKNTPPFKYPGLQGEKGPNLSKTKIKELLDSNVIRSEKMRTLGNLQRLFIAANEIRRQRNVTSLDFKSVLQIKKKAIGRVPQILKYGDSFRLTPKERYTLSNVKPYQEKEAERNRINKKKRKDLIKFKDVYDRDRSTRAKGWYAFYRHISRYEMYTESGDVDRALEELPALSVKYFELPKGQRRLRPRLKLSGSVRAFFSPIKNSRTQETMPDHKHQYDDYRHTAEIAAFHLDRILGFRRAIPCVGRTFSITQDFLSVPGNDHLQRNFTSLIGNTCIKVRGKKRHEEYNYMCGNPDNIEGALELDISQYNLTMWPYLWRQTNNLRGKAFWETDSSYCDDVRMTSLYNGTRRLLDVIDLAILDFLQGNMDRQVYHTFTQFGRDTFILHTNNSRGFGKAFHDELSILAPLYQCCTIRFSTFQTLLDFELGPSRLSDVMSASLSRDPIAPILLDQHLLALDRRLRITLKMVYECISLNGAAKVVILDGF